jgi:hypothetical protein
MLADGHCLGGLLFRWNSGPVIGLFVTTSVLFISLAAQRVLMVGTTEDHSLVPVKYLRSNEIVTL